MEFRCRLSDVDDMVFRLREAVKEPLRTYEVHPTKESLSWGRSMVCEYDYTVRVPALKLFFCDAVEFEFDEEEQDDMPVEEILHCYREGEAEPMYGVYDSIRSHVLWYIKEAGLSVENAEELECVIDFPYDVDLKENDK